jgi:hypothetical protein
METAIENRAGTVRNTVRVDQNGFIVILGIWAWLFTIGLLHLSFWQGVLAIILWPYYLGTTFTPPLH